MSNIYDILTSDNGGFSNTITKCINYLEQHIPGYASRSSWLAYFNDIASTSREELIDDFSNLRVTPATTTVVLTTFLTILVASKLLGGTPPPKDTKKPKKKTKSKAQIANAQIQTILDNVEETYVAQIDDYIENFGQLSKDKKENTYNYIQEMLLKELLKLDGIDIAGNEVLRDNRKKVIRFIQEHQSRLDQFKKDNQTS